MIHGKDLDRFYALGGGSGHPIGNVPTPSRRDWLPERLEAGLIDDGVTRLLLDVQGVHCAACVWLFDQLGRRQGGLLRLELNPTRGQLMLLFESAEFEIHRFLDDVEHLGYRVAPASALPRGTDRSLLLRMGICSALAMNSMTFALAGYLGLDTAQPQIHALFGALAFALAAIAVVVGGPVFFRAALLGVRRRALHLDLPISLGILLAFGGSTYQYMVASGEPYFDTVTIFVALMLVGRFLQQRSVAKSRDYLLTNDGATHLRARVFGDSGLERRPISKLRVGDQILLSPGDLVPTDCRAIDAAGTFSLDWINGESRPRALAVGERIPAGAFLRSRQSLRVEVILNPGESGMMEMLATPTGDRDDRTDSRFWRQLNRFYVVGVLGCAAAAGLVWLFVDPSRAVEVVVSVLVVTCPCALGLATPLAFEMVLTALRKHGIYVRTTSLLERARRIRKVIFDKTGTLTWGDLRASSLRTVPEAHRDVLFTMVQSSNHPVSRSIAQLVGTRERQFLECMRNEEIPGEGIRAEYGGREYRLGSTNFVFGEVASAVSDGVCLFACDGHVEGCFQIEEDLRDGFAEEIDRLRSDGQMVFVMSGDSRDKVDAVADTLALRRDRTFAELSPNDKAELIRRLDDDDTLMVGDGLNDAPAFEAAYCAGAAALDLPVMPARSDFFFLGGGSTAVRRTLEAGRLLHRIVVTNLWLAAIYNATVLVLCFAGLMSPVLCAILMPLSSIALLWHTAWHARRGNA